MIDADTIEPRVVHSPAAEQSVLGALMFDPQALHAAGRLESGHFYDQRHARIFTAIARLIGANLPADLVSVFEDLRRTGDADECGGIEYLNQLAMCVASAANVARHAAIVREKAAERAVCAAADQAMTVAAGKGSAAEKIDRIAGLFAGLQREQIAKVPRSIADIAIERTEHYAKLERGEVAAGWPTRIPALDAMLNGGLRAGGLYIVAARPSVGKSSFSQAIGLTMARAGMTTLFLSQEMADEEVADRAVSHVGRIDYSDLQSGRLGDDGWSRAAEAMDDLRGMPFFVDDQPALSLLDVKGKANSVRGVRVLILDYLQLCSSRSDAPNRNAEIEEISRGLKAMAKDRGIAVIALSQLNREVEKRGDKRPNLSDLRDSGAIEQDADVVMFLWPVREFANEGRRIVGCAVAKNRQGRCGEFGLDFYGATQRWAESTADIRQQTPIRKGADL